MNNILTPLASVCGWSKGYRSVSPVEELEENNNQGQHPVNGAPLPVMLAKCATSENVATAANATRLLLTSSGVVFLDAGVARFICNGMMDRNMHDVAIDPSVSITVGIVLFTLGLLPSILKEDRAHRVTVLKNTLSEAALLSVACI